MGDNEENKCTNDKKINTERKEEIDVMNKSFNEKKSFVSKFILSISEIRELEMSIVMKLRTSENYEHEFVSKSNQLAKILEKNKI